jgi:DNA topoisomerase-1
MLDMLVGFTISRVLWKRVAPKLSAGRCQTPTLRLVVERDKEIQTHTARNYWVLRGVLDPGLDMKAEGEWDAEGAAATLQTLLSAKKVATLTAIKERLSTSGAPAPLITSSLQQEASSLHGLNPKQTMAAAQKLYEMGHITYMRTDNPQLSTEAAAILRDQVESTWGKEYVGSEGQHTLGQEPKPAKKTKKAAKAAKEPSAPVEAQAAHEAIRPTHPDVLDLPELEHAQQVVYRLIWRRAIQSQMVEAKTHVRSLGLQTPDGTSWKAEQTKPAFDGWRIVEQTEKSKQAAAAEEVAWDRWTPLLTQGAEIPWTSLTADEVFTKPPGRYTEATLIGEIKKRGIGRPSTYATLVTTLLERDYVERTNVEGKPYETKHLTITPKSKAPKETKETHKSGAEKNKLRATPLGVSVSECLTTEFSDLFAYDFTATMESGLDAISGGTKAWKSILQETWDTYKERYERIQGEAGTRSTQVGDATAKLIQTRRGPLLVRPKEDGTGDEFAPLPEGTTPANVGSLTEEQIQEAFATARVAKEGEVVGVWDDHDMRKKKGPYGYYVEADGVKVPWKPDDTEETLVAKLTAKKGAFERKVGDFTIKQGPYGLYFYKHTLKTKSFHKFPASEVADTVTAERLSELAKAPKPKYVPKGKGKAKVTTD